MTTEYGKKEVIKYGIICLLTVVFCLVLSLFLWKAFAWFIVIPVIEYVFVLYFFRDPERKVVENLNNLLAPADGIVSHIEECEDPGYLGEKAIRISIFLSILNVHINRAAYPGKVSYIKYKKGEFLNAMGNDSLHLNECNDIGVKTDNPKMKKYMQRQIVGLIARRIVCDLNEGDSLVQGQRYGMMKFGSRTDLFIPKSTAAIIKINVGDKVEAGLTVLASI